MSQCQIGYQREKECKEGYLYTEVGRRGNVEGRQSPQQMPGQKLRTVSESLRKDSPGQLLGLLSIGIYLCEGKMVLEVCIQEY